MRIGLRIYVISFLIGVAAIAALLVVSFTALGLAAGADGWKSFEIGIGPFCVFAFDRTGDATEMSLGNGILAIAFAAGLANAVAAALLRRRMRAPREGDSQIGDSPP